MTSLMLIHQNYDGTHKTIQVYNGKHTCNCISKEEKKSVTATNEELTLACMLYVFEEREIMGSDVSNVFIQVKHSEEEGKESV